MVFFPAKKNCFLISGHSFSDYGIYKHLQFNKTKQKDYENFKKCLLS